MAHRNPEDAVLAPNARPQADDFSRHMHAAGQPVAVEVAPPPLVKTSLYFTVDEHPSRPPSLTFSLGDKMRRT